MVFPILVFLVVYFFIATELIDKTVVALIGAGLMIGLHLVAYEEALHAIDMNVLFLLIGMMIAALEHSHVFEKMGEFILHICRANLMATALTILWFSAIASAIVDNIPLVMAMIPLVKGIIPVFALQMGLQDAAIIQAQIAEPLLWALALGACLGGIGTLVGASANVVIAQVAKRNNCPISFWSFTKCSFPFMIASLLIAHLYLYSRFFM